jgi:predicted nicotinamide N-methyase
MELLSARKFEEAGLAFEQALELNPDAIETWSALGICMHELGQTEAALVCQRQVKRLHGIGAHGTEAAAKESEVRDLASSTTALPPLPDGRAPPTIATGSLAACDTGGKMWSSAHALCRFQLQHAARFAASTVLELGCGTGAVGIYAAALGASRVTLTDGGPPAVLALAQSNVDANQRAGLWSDRTRVEVLRLEWGPSASSALESDGETVDDGAAARSRFDWILGSDVTYSMGAHTPLCQTIRASLLLGGAGSGCRAVLAHEHRVAREGAIDERLVSLRKAAAAQELDVTVLSTEREGERQISLLEVALSTPQDG